MELLMDLAFMIFGLGFFLFSVWAVLHFQREIHSARVAEAREFGIDGMRQLNDPKPSKKR